MQMLIESEAKEQHCFCSLLLFVVLIDDKLCISTEKCGHIED